MFRNWSRHRDKCRKSGCTRIILMMWMWSTFMPPNSILTCDLSPSQPPLLPMPCGSPLPSPHSTPCHVAHPFPTPTPSSHLRPVPPEHQLWNGKPWPLLLSPLLAGAAGSWPAVFPSPSGAPPGETVEAVKEHTRRRTPSPTPGPVRASQPAQSRWTLTLNRSSTLFQNIAIKY